MEKQFLEVTSREATKLVNSLKITVKYLEDERDRVISTPLGKKIREEEILEYKKLREKIIDNLDNLEIEW